MPPTSRLAWRRGPVAAHVLCLCPVEPSRLASLAAAPIRDRRPADVGCATPVALRYALVRGRTAELVLSPPLAASIDA